MTEKKVAWSSFTKAELIRTIKSLDKRQTKLLNEIAQLKAERVDVSYTAVRKAANEAAAARVCLVSGSTLDDPSCVLPYRAVFPWEQD